MIDGPAQAGPSWMRSVHQLEGDFINVLPLSVQDRTCMPYRSWYGLAQNNNISSTKVYMGRKVIPTCIYVY